MVNKLRDEINGYLDERHAVVLEEALRLKMDDRVDESNVLKAKANIYDVFKSLCNVSAKQSSNKAQFEEELNKKSITIPAAWEKSLEVAKAHNDTIKIMIEEAKLSAVYEIREKIASIMQGKSV